MRIALACEREAGDREQLHGGSRFLATPDRHALVAATLARDVIGQPYVAAMGVKAAADLHLQPIDGGQAVEVSVRLRISAEDLADKMLVLLDEALHLDGALLSTSAWSLEQVEALARAVAGAGGSMGPLADDPDATIAVGTGRLDGALAAAAKDLIVRLGLGQAFDVLATFAHEHFAEPLVQVERQGA